MYIYIYIYTYYIKIVQVLQAGPRNAFQRLPLRASAACALVPSLLSVRSVLINILRATKGGPKEGGLNIGQPVGLNM